MAKISCLLGFLLVQRGSSKNYVQSEVIAFVAPTQLIVNRELVPISLVVPSIFQEVKCVDILMRSLVQVTRLPSETIVVASGDRNLFTNEISRLKAMLSNYSSMIPNVKLVLLSGQQHQGVARNFGANLSTNSIISFFDGDDYMHPQRFEILYKYLLLYPSVDVILHNYQSFVYEETIKTSHISNVTVMLTPEEIWKRYQALGWNHSSDPTTKIKMDSRGIGVGGLRQDYQRLYLIWVFPEYSSLQNGWSTMKRSVIDAVPFIPFRGAEDSLHNAIVIIRGYNVLAIDSRLGYYRNRVGNQRRKSC